MTDKFNKTIEENDEYERTWLDKLGSSRRKTRVVTFEDLPFKKNPVAYGETILIVGEHQGFVYDDNIIVSNAPESLRISTGNPTQAKASMGIFNLHLTSDPYVRNVGLWVTADSRYPAQVYTKIKEIRRNIPFNLHWIDLSARNHDDVTVRLRGYTHEGDEVGSVDSTLNSQSGTKVNCGFNGITRVTIEELEATDPAYTSPVWVNTDYAPSEGVYGIGLSSMCVRSLRLPLTASLCTEYEGEDL